MFVEVSERRNTSDSSSEDSGSVDNHFARFASTDVPPPEPKCENCQKTESEAGQPHKKCARCKTSYCSRECQKADWKQHKKICATIANATDSAPSARPTNRTNALKVTVTDPFQKLVDNTWLHNRPKEDVFKLLIDVYRLRMDDQYTFEGECDRDCIYGGAPNSERGFRRFLRRVERKQELLPTWWSRQKADECVLVGRRSGALTSAVEKSDIEEDYDDPTMPSQLREFGGKVYGRAYGGGSGGDLMSLLAQMTGNTI